MDKLEPVGHAVGIEAEADVVFGIGGDDAQPAAEVAKLIQCVGDAVVQADARQERLLQREELGHEEREAVHRDAVGGKELPRRHVAKGSRIGDRRQSVAVCQPVEYRDRTGERVGECAVEVPENQPVVHEL